MYNKNYNAVVGSSRRDMLEFYQQILTDFLNFNVIYGHNTSEENVSEMFTEFSKVMDSSDKFDVILLDGSFYVLNGIANKCNELYKRPVLVTSSKDFDNSQLNKGVWVIQKPHKIERFKKTLFDLIEQHGLL